MQAGDLDQRVLIEVPSATVDGDLVNSDAPGTGKPSDLTIGATYGITLDAVRFAPAVLVEDVVALRLRVVEEEAARAAGAQRANARQHVVRGRAAVEHDGVAGAQLVALAGDDDGADAHAVVLRARGVGVGLGEGGGDEKNEKEAHIGREKGFERRVNTAVQSDYFQW